MFVDLIELFLPLVFPFITRSGFVEAFDLPDLLNLLCNFLLLRVRPFYFFDILLYFQQLLIFYINFLIFSYLFERIHYSTLKNILIKLKNNKNKGKLIKTNKNKDFSKNK